MENRGMLNDLLARLGKVVGLGELALDAEDVCSLEFDSRHVVNIGLDDARGELVLFARLGRIEAGQETEAYRAMLEANLFGSGTGGAVLSLSKASGEVVITRAAPLVNLDYPQFETLVSEFISAAEIWATALKGIQGSNFEQPPTDLERALFLRV